MRSYRSNMDELEETLGLMCDGFYECAMLIRSDASMAALAENNRELYREVDDEHSELVALGCIPTTMAFEGFLDGSTVCVDGVYRAQLPLSAPFPVAPGTRHIAVGHDGCTIFNATVYVERTIYVEARNDIPLSIVDHYASQFCDGDAPR